MANLFRQEVVARRGTALFDGMVIRSGSRSTLLSVAALSLALAVVVVATVGTYARKEVAHGALVPAAGLIAVASPRSGVVADVAVADGELVARDQPLFTIVSAADATDGTNADAAQLDLLLAERAAVAAQSDAERRLADAEAADLERRAASARTQAALLAEQLEAADRRLQLLRADVERVERLATRGHVAVNLLDLKLADLLDGQQAILTLRREHERQRHEADELDAQRAALPARHDLRVGELHARALALDRAIAAADARWSLTVRAPAPGRVDALRLHSGQAVAADSVALTVVPEGSPLHAELVLPARSAGFIAPGHPVRVRYDAYPFQKFGLHQAVVRSVSRAALASDGAGAAYRVVADIEHQTVRAHGDEIPLRPGMTLQADIVRDRRRIIEWLFEPVIAAARS